MYIDAHVVVYIFVKFSDRDEDYTGSTVTGLCNYITTKLQVGDTAGNDTATTWRRRVHNSV